TRSATGPSAGTRQAGHFLVHEGRPFAYRHVRLQTAVAARRWQTAALRKAARAIRADEQPARFSLEIPAVWRVRAMGQRIVSPRRPARRRPLHAAWAARNERGARRRLAQAAHGQR